MTILLLILYFASIGEFLKSFSTFLCISLNVAITLIAYARHMKSVSSIEYFLINFIFFLRKFDWNKYTFYIESSLALFEVLLMFAAVIIQFLYENTETFTCLLEILLMFMFIMELKIVRAVLNCYINVMSHFRRDIEQSYEDFHKIPAAEFKKLDNGDLVLLGWIKQALNCKNSSKNALRIRKIAAEVVIFMKNLKDYNQLFAISPLVICVSFFLHMRNFQLQSCSTFSIACTLHCIKAVYFMSMIIKIWENLKNLDNKVEEFGLVNYRLYLDMPFSPLLKEDTSIKSTFLFLYKFCYLNRN
ncbi:hypothetical protein ABEB36_012548 [Hypothenemus hampei]|uniref:Uncharacterized protein n=1 Tax=Hypothenemus hampei TaxID=57062 RepID=A0ABD1EEC5_HYPHA